MKSLSVVVFAAAVAALSTLAGCAAETNSDTASTSSTDDFTVSIMKLSGAYTSSDADSEGAAFKGIVFDNDGHFFADVNTGDSTARISGEFKVAGHSVTLSPPANAVDEFYGTYDVTIGDDDSITLSKSGTTAATTVKNTLKAQPSYCAAAVDCDAQNLIHPMCAPGGWTCTAASACSFSCGN